MARTVLRPAEEVREEIRTLEEFPAFGNTPGIVRVLVGVINEAGTFIVPQQFQTFMIEGEYYEQLVGPAGGWAPEKPDGTYRNEDLWYFIDLFRARAAEDTRPAAEAAAGALP